MTLRKCRWGWRGGGGAGGREVDWGENSDSIVIRWQKW